MIRKHRPSRASMSAVAVILFASSCTTPPRAPLSGFAGGQGPEVLGVQYAAVTGNDGFETVEVFLANKGSASVTFTNAVLDGTTLLGEKNRASRLAADRFRFDIGGKRVAAPKPVPPLNTRTTRLGDSPPFLPETTCSPIPTSLAPS